MIRTSLSISGSRISDHDFTNISLFQQMGGHHTFEVRLRQDAKKGVLMEKAKAWIGETIALGFDYHKDAELDAMPVAEIFKGIVTSIELSRVMAVSEIVVKGHSPTITMEDGPITRSFTDTGMQEIVDKVMKPYEKFFTGKVSVSTESHSATIDYTVQYRENAFTFVNRLANRFGEWFYYDGIDLHFGKKPSSKPISLDFGSKGLQYFDILLKTSPLQQELKGYDYRSHKTISADVSEKSPTNAFGDEVMKKSKSIFSEKATVSFQTDLEDSELKQMAKRSAATATEGMVVLTASSTNCNLVPGAIVDIEDKSIGEKYGKYILTSISHNISEGGDYSNSFEAVPSETKMPPTTDIPRAPFCETQLGTVKSVDDPDASGRVQVELQWQEKTGETTPWIRVTSPYTGKDKGFYIVPEVDDQVLVSFEDSNPDKPYVLAGIYHGKAKPELFTPKNDVKGFKSREDNKINFDDKEKTILLSGDKKLDLFAKNEINIKTNSSGKINLDAGDNGEITITAKTIILDATDAIKINGQKDVAVEGGKTVEVKAGMELKQEATNISAKAKAKLENAGASLDLKGSAMVMVKGGLVKIN